MSFIPSPTATLSQINTFQRNETIDRLINIAFSVSCALFVLLSLLIAIRCYQRHKYLKLLESRRSGSETASHPGVQNPDYLYQ